MKSVLNTVFKKENKNTYSDDFIRIKVSRETKLYGMISAYNILKEHITEKNHTCDICGNIILCNEPMFIGKNLYKVSLHKSCKYVLDNIVYNKSLFDVKILGKCGSGILQILGYDNKTIFVCDNMTFKRYRVDTKLPFIITNMNIYDIIRSITPYNGEARCYSCSMIGSDITLLVDHIFCKTCMQPTAQFISNLIYKLMYMNEFMITDINIQIIRIILDIINIVV